MPLGVSRHPLLPSSQLIGSLTTSGLDGQHERRDDRERSRGHMRLSLGRSALLI